MARPLTGPYGAVFMDAPIGLGLHLGVWNDWTYLVVGKRLPEDFRLAAVARFIHVQPFNFNSDKLGVAYICDRPTDSTRKNEHGMEFFWRFQLTSSSA